MAIVKGEKRGRPGRWLVDYRDGAGIRRVITCQTLEEAKDVDAAKRQESRQRTSPVVDPAITLDQYAERWLAQVKATTKVSTWETYSDVYRRHIQPTLGGRKVRGLQKQHCKALFLHKLNEDRGRAYVKLMFAVLRGLLNAAVDDGVILSNPCAGLGRVLKLGSKPGADEEEVAAFEREQIAVFLAAVTTKYHPFFLTLARAGLRLGEGLALQWGDLDLTARTARIVRTYSKGRLGTPKGNRPRSVDLSRQLTDTLRHHHAHQAAKALKTGKPLAPWCFTTATGGPLDGSRIRKVMARTLKAAGLPTHHNPKSLRHTFGSLLAERGESPQYIQVQMGHRDITTTMRIYARWFTPKALQGGPDGLDDASGSNLVSRAAVAGGNINPSAKITSADPPTLTWTAGFPKVA